MSKTFAAVTLAVAFVATMVMSFAIEDAAVSRNPASVKALSQ